MAVVVMGAAARSPELPVPGARGAGVGLGSCPVRTHARPLAPHRRCGGCWSALASGAPYVVLRGEGGEGKTTLAGEAGALAGQPLTLRLGRVCQSGRSPMAHGERDDRLLRASQTRGKSGDRQAGGATVRPRTLCLAIVRATSPVALMSSMKAHRYRAPAGRPFGVPAAC